MNLSIDKNILLAKKAVYAEQLSYYSKLCKTYQELAKIAESDPRMTADDIAKRYAKPLTMIIDSDDLEKTLQDLADDYVFPSREKETVGLYMGKRFSKAEINLFRQFAKTSSIFKTFQMASDKLTDVSEAEGLDRDAALLEFHTFMQSENRPKTIRNFDTTLTVHSPRYIGSRYYVIANRSLNDINEVDQTHIPLDKVTVQNSLTPENFGAIISGYKSLPEQIEDLERETLDEEDFKPTRHFDIDNWDITHPSNRKMSEARDEFDSLKTSVAEKAFVAGSAIKHHASKFYKAHKGTAKKALITAAAIALIAGGAKQAATEIRAHNLDINSSTEYEQTITDETRDYINNIIEDLGLQTDSFDPQYQDVKAIEENIDLVLDYVVRDQVTTAFEDYHQGWKVTDVQTWFNKNYQGSSSEPRNYQFVDVSYIDEEGKEGLESISDFRSEALTISPLKSIFELEENIDLNSPVWGAFNNNGTKNFLEKAQGIDDVFQYLTDATKLVKKVAAFDMEHGHSIFGNPYLKSTIPEKNNDGEER